VPLNTTLAVLVETMVAAGERMVGAGAQPPERREGHTVIGTITAPRLIGVQSGSPKESRQRHHQGVVRDIWPPALQFLVDPHAGKLLKLKDIAAGRGGHPAPRAPARGIETGPQTSLRDFKVSNS
jgi:hypothetical protein